MEADLQPDGWRHWRDFEKALELSGKNFFPSDVEALDRDRGQTLGLVRLRARRTEVMGVNLYEPGLGVRVGVEK
ncbi:MAG: hypothetical protein QM765_36440 [Myxococcales bacterium]